MDRKGSDLYKDDVKNNGESVFKVSQLVAKPSALKPKNVNVSSLLGSKKISYSKDKRKPLLSLSQKKSPVLSSQDENKFKPLSSVIRHSKMPMRSQGLKDQQQYTLRRCIRRENGQGGLAGQLLCTLNDFNLAVRTSQSNQNYDILVGVERVAWLSPFEIMVMSSDTRLKRAVLHSHKPIPRFKHSPSKLAICSKCSLRLYNDINWYLKWKFV